MAKKREAREQYINILHLLKAKFKEIALNMFIWEGLPEGVEADIIEGYLYERGQVMFFEDPNLSYLTLPCFGHSPNVYNRHQMCRVEGHNYTREVTIDPERKGVVGVVIKNTYLKMSTEAIVHYYCSKLTDIDQTIDVNVKANKSPIIFEGDDKALLTMKNIYQQITDNEPVLYVNKMKGEGETSLNAIKTDVPFIALELRNLYRDYEAEILTYLGINNSPRDKKERVQSAEVDSNNEHIVSHLDKMLTARQEAVEKINKLFGLSMSVKVNPELEAEELELEMEEEQVEEKEEEVGNDG